MITPVTSRRLLRRVLLVAMTLVGLVSCRDPAELQNAVTAILVVVDVDEDDIVEVTIGGLTRQAAPKASDNLVSFNLALPTGTHAGALTILEQEDEGPEPKRCGPITINIPEASPDGPVLVAVGVDDLGECPEDEDDTQELEVDDGGGEGEPAEGEGEGEGEGEIDEDPTDDPAEGEGEDPAEGEGEGEGEGEAP